ncbi:hypothetical protein P691DRAFT_696356 [Macrolepiota fuliginosa MF-IS2]|uniref:RanBD1 domain-containing protein n=1 Tax=Macrolepiota fuliginosa MF-IS2 TaxID=1400762 RepID=A0A9P5XN39_9AGAR|nr:hypothetical protein P691DRAFT_696356 [Macrolepiota fuliginosa MF-IS2]
MKRGAEKQISKDDYRDEDGEDETPQVGFKKADETVLATRQIRGLPKRASVASIPQPAAETGSTKFGGFSGFAGASSFSGFPSSTSTSIPPTSSFQSTTGPTNTAKALSSFLGPPRPATTSTPSSVSPSASPFGTSPVPPAVPPAASPLPMQKDNAVDPAELKYYTSLRGLNESVRSAIAKAIDDDPFSDITVFLERYKSLRAEIQKDYDANASMDTSPTPAPVTKTFSMPAPPSGGFAFGGIKAPTDAKPTLNGTGGGFTPTFTTQTSGFTFGKPTESKPSPFSAPSSDTSKKTDAPPTSSPSTLGFKPSDEKKDSASTAVPSFFNPKPSEDKTTSSIFSTGSFKPKDEKDTPPQPKSIFGLPSSTASTGSFTFGVTGGTTNTSTNSTNPPSSDSTTSQSRFAGFSGFGTPTTGFTFGNTPSTITPTALAPAAAAATPSGSGDGAETTDDPSKKSVAESFSLSADNKHDQEGAGEEDESTQHSIKLKAYIMKDTKGVKNWVEMGYGVFRIKKHKENGLRRVLLRSSSTGQILINFSFHSAFKPAQKGKNVTFIGHDAEGSSKMYTLKLQTEDQAVLLKDALDKEIKAKEETSSQ